MEIEKPKILCLFSAPLVTPNGEPINALDIEKEREDIIRELSACNRQISLRIGFATVDGLARGITDGYNILHLSGHGNKDFLLFEDGKAGSQLVTGEYLKKLIGTGGPFELAIVSSCHSENIAKLINKAGIRHVIAIKQSVPVLDVAATTFIGQFYRNIFRCEPIQKAFKMAKLLVEGNPELAKIKSQLEITAQIENKKFVAEENKFVLIPQPISFHSDPLISKNIPQGDLEIDEQKLSKTNIVVRPQSFTGRSSELHEIINLLFISRLVTIIGAGGIGKTTAAMEVARWFHLRGYFPDGIYHVDLRHVTTISGIVDMLSAVFETPFKEMKDIVSYLKEHRCLLFFDNAEEVLWKNEQILHDIFNMILKATPHNKLLITSQRHIGGDLHEPERIYRLVSIEPHEAARLFFMTAKREMTIKELKSNIFNSLLNQLGGHPLSIILIARQLLPGTSISDLVERVKNYKAKAIAVKLITDRDPEHGESLIAALSSAYDNLSDNAKTLFQILSMLPAGAQKFTIERIMDDKKAWEYAHELYDAGLSEITDNPHIYLLPPIRLFSMSTLQKNVKEKYGPKILRLMALYARQFYINLGTNNAQENRFYFTMEEPNLRSAIDLPCAPLKENEPISALGLLATFLFSLYVLHHRLHDAEDVGDRIIRNLRELNDKMGEANTLQALGDLAMRQSKLTDAEDKYGKALDIFKQIDEKMGEANTLKALGDLAMRQSKLTDAEYKYGKALDIYKQIDEKMGEANTLKALGDLAMRQSKLTNAEDKYGKALDIFKQIDEKMGEANTIMRLGQLFAFNGNCDSASNNFNSAFATFKEIEDVDGQADAHMGKALVFLKCRLLEKAHDELNECLSIRDKAYSHGEAAQWLIIYANHLKSQNLMEEANLCLEYAEKFALKAQDVNLQKQIKQIL